MALIYLRIPPDEALSSRSGWQAAGNDTFIAMQAHVAGVPARAAITRKGPPTEVIRLAEGAEYTAELKRIRVETYTEEITGSIEQTITTKFAAEVSAKMASEIGVSAPMSSAKFSAEVQAKSGIELASAVRRSLAARRSFEVQESQEVRRSVTYKAPHDTVLQFHLEYWPWRWEFYVYRAELLRLRYKHHWVWRDVRETVEKRVVEPHLPLFAVTFYEPQDTQSVTVDDYTPEVTDGDVIKVEPLTAETAPATLPAFSDPPGPSLEDLARLAFPTTRAERRTARAGKKAAARGKKSAPRKAGAKRASAKRKAAKKATPKKSAVRKAASKKSATRKAGSKKSATRKSGSM
jgi:hypothetical protein